MTTEFDIRLNQWFDAVEPKQLPSSILPRVFDEVDRMGQRRKPWQRFAASIELGWTRRSALSPTLVLVILTALLIIVAAAVGVGSGLIRMPLPAEIIHGEANGLIAVEDAQDEALGPDQLPHYQIRFIDPQTGDNVFTTPASVRSCGAHFSPDGSQYAFLYDDPNDDTFGQPFVAVAPAKNDAQPTLLERKPAQAYFDPSWAPDGSALVMTWEVPVDSGMTRELRIVPTDGSPGRTITDIPTSLSADWSPSGEWVAFVAEVTGHKLYAIRPDGSDLHQMLPSAGGAFVAWSPLRDELAYTVADGEVRIIALDGHQLFAGGGGQDPATADPVPYPGGDLVPKWSPDATKIALIPDGTLQVFDVAANSVTQVKTPTLVASAEWSPDGQSLVVVTAPVGVYPGDLWQVYPDGSEPRQIAQHVQAHCMSDGKALSWQSVTK